MGKNIFIKGELHTYSPMDASLLKEEGVTFHVKGKVYFHPIDDDFIYDKDDMFVEDIFKEYDVKDIIAFSIKTED